MTDAEPEEHPLEGLREHDRKRILHALDNDAELRDMVARWMATNAALARLNGGEPAVAYQNPLAALGLDDVWTGRLVKMASAADVTPQQYLERLIRRAWVGLPMAMRAGS